MNGLPEPRREALGRVVRKAWIEWAEQQPAPKLSWLIPWDHLDADQREVDMRIGEAVAAAVLAGQFVVKLGAAGTTHGMFTQREADDYAAGHGLVTSNFVIRVLPPEAGEAA